MRKRRRLLVPILLSVLLLTACAVQPPGMMGPAMGMDRGMMQRHMAPIPAEYASLRNPVPADTGSLARGKAIYEANCAACHGNRGGGDGPAGADLSPAPAPIGHTGQMLSDGYLIYRISEGGNFAPFNSAMPAWKEKLDETERWDVINYVRSLGSNSTMGTGMMGGGMMDGGMMSWMMVPWLFLGWVLVIGVIAAIMIALVWTVRRSSGSGQRAETPLEILKRRFARGEITPEQFETMKRQLSGD